MPNPFQSLLQRARGKNPPAYSFPHQSTDTHPSLTSILPLYPVFDLILDELLLVAPLKYCQLCKHFRARAPPSLLFNYLRVDDKLVDKLQNMYTRQATLERFAEARVVCVVSPKVKKRLNLVSQRLASGEDGPPVTLFPNAKRFEAPSSDYW
ncbi:hypothetical protein IAT38_007459 [Cryptococcus sp. DSM 104549]